MTDDLRRVLQVLRRSGLLLEADAALPSVVTLVAREPVHGSWWRHEKAGTIYGLTQELAGHRDVVVTKLVSAKLTYVHRRFWSPLVSIATARQPWQILGLSATADTALRLVTKHGEIASHDLPLGDRRLGKIGDAIRELERRLLIHSKEIHTPTGAHAKLLTTWERWTEGAGPVETDWDPDDAKHEFEERIAGLNRKHGGTGRLPWPVTLT